MDELSDDILFDNAGSVEPAAVALHQHTKSPRSAKASKAVRPAPTRGQTKLSESTAPSHAQISELHQRVRSLEADNQVLSAQVRALTAQAAATPASEPVTKRLAELNGRIRSLTSMHEAQKTKNTQLQTLIETQRAELTQMQRRLEKAQSAASRHAEPRDPGLDADSDAAADTSADHAADMKGGSLPSLRGGPQWPAPRVDNATLSRMGQLSMKANTLAAENARLRTLLARETGREPAALADLVDNPASFKGRAEEIQLLRAQVKRLRGELSEQALLYSANANAGVDDGSGSGAKAGESTDPIHALAPTALLAAGDHALTVREQHAAQVSALTASLNERAAHEAELAAGLEAAQARCRQYGARVAGLNSEVDVLRGKARVLLAKSRHDDLLIDSLRGYLEAGARPRGGGAGRGAARGDGAVRDQLAAAELRAGVAETKLRDVLQTVAASENQAVYIAAAAQLEAHGAREMLASLSRTVDELHQRLRRDAETRFAAHAVASENARDLDDALAAVRNTYEAQLSVKGYQLGELQKLVAAQSQALGALRAREDGPSADAPAGDLPAAPPAVSNQDIAQAMTNLKRRKRVKNVAASPGTAPPRDDAASSEGDPEGDPEDSR